MKRTVFHDGAVMKPTLWATLMLVFSLSAGVFAEREEREERGRGDRAERERGDRGDRERYRQRGESRSRELPPAASRQVSYIKDVRPILEERCANCHGDGAHKGHFSIDTRAQMLSGGEHGGAVRPGDSASSRMIRMVAGAGGDPMPPKGSRLSAEQIGILRAWIDQGAKWEADPDAAPKDPLAKAAARDPRSRAAAPGRSTEPRTASSAASIDAGSQTAVPAGQTEPGPQTAAPSALAAGVNRPVSFVTDIKPILDARCADCHADGSAKGGFSIDTRDELLKGGKGGPALRAGDSGQSKLVRMLAGAGEKRMPPKGTPLTPDQIALIRAWIDQGAKWDMK